MMSDLPKSRVSTVKDDIGYMEGVEKSGIKIFVDDIEVQGCFTADERRGCVTVVERDCNNKLVRNDGSINRVLVKGKVRIEGLSQGVREAHADRMANRRVMSDE